MVLAVARPLDAMEPGEDLSLAEIQERWMDLIHEHVLASASAAALDGLPPDLVRHPDDCDCWLCRDARGEAV